MSLAAQRRYFQLEVKINGLTAKCAVARLAISLSYKLLNFV